MEKYEFTDEVKIVDGHTLHRIRAVRDFGDVHAGELGGFVERKSNLPYEDDAWVRDEAIVLGFATVTDRAVVRDHAVVRGHALVSNYAVVCGHAVVRGCALVGDHAVVRDYAVVGGYSVVLDRKEVSGHTVQAGEEASK